MANKEGGFTLVELLVALGIMTLLSMLSWRGVDGILQAKTQLSSRIDDTQALQVSLNQFSIDLDEMAHQPGLDSIDWNGRGLRILRRGTLKAGDGLYVVAWAAKFSGNTRNWVRWKSREVRTRKELLDAWKAAEAWSKDSSETPTKQEQRAIPIEGWDVYFLRKAFWTNPMSSASTADDKEAPPISVNFMTWSVSSSISCPMSACKGGKVNQNHWPMRFTNGCCCRGKKSPTARPPPKHSITASSAGRR